MQRRVIYFVIGAAILTVGWYLFRPELLFINKTVDDAANH